VIAADNEMFRIITASFHNEDNSLLEYRAVVIIHRPDDGGTTHL
jgi:hypothetical protein